MGFKKMSTQVSEISDRMLNFTHTLAEVGIQCAWSEEDAKTLHQASLMLDSAERWDAAR